MEVVDTIAEFRARLDMERAAGRTIGFAPTMGALHDGHLSLMAAAVERNDVGVASIFVNPLQFGDSGDLEAYPKTLDADAAMAKAAGTSLLFVPSGSEMFPEPSLTTVSVNGITEPWEGASRPVHFDGVATVVSKLFNIVGPCSAYFGEKDYQQLAMIRRMVADLNFPIDLVGMPTMREADGLAMSSRNRRLTTEQRRDAPVVHRALRAGFAAIEGGDTDPASVVNVVRAEFRSIESVANADYVAVVDAANLVVPDVLVGEIRLLSAVRFGDVRLIDNVGVSVPARAYH